MDAHEFLLLRLRTLQQLKELKKGIDPAAGMTICVRQGVAADNPDREDDSERRPWITVETGDGMDTILTALIASQVRSVALWKDSTERDIAEGQKALATLAATPL